MVGALFRRTDRTHFDRLLWQARLLKEAARFYAQLGRLLVDARATGRDAIRHIEDKIGWDQLGRSIRFAEDITWLADDGLAEVIERYPPVRRFAPTFLAAFTLRTARSGDPLLSAIEALQAMYRDGRSVLSKRVPTSFIKPRWRKVVEPSLGMIDRRLRDPRDRPSARTARFGQHLGGRQPRLSYARRLPVAVPAFEAMHADGNLRLAVSSGSPNGMMSAAPCGPGV
jgi:hypothetical protein